MLMRQSVKKCKVVFEIQISASPYLFSFFNNDGMIVIIS